VRKGLGGEKHKYVVEPKVDGVAVSLRYEKSRLILAATRGDGRRGDEHHGQCPNDPFGPGCSFPSPGMPGEGWGEGSPRVSTNSRGPRRNLHGKAVFQAINKKRQEAGEEVFRQSPKLHRRHPEATRSESYCGAQTAVRCPTVWDKSSHFPCDSYWDCTQILKGLGFPLPQDVVRCDDIEQVIRKIEAFLRRRRGKLAYQTDGM